MDFDAFVAAHRAEWARLDALTRRRGTLTGDEADEMVLLYRRVSTHLSVLRSTTPDPALLSRLSGTVARARAKLGGRQDPAWRHIVRYVTVGFPAAVYLSRRWWITAALASAALAVVIGWWVAANPDVQATIGAPQEIRQLVEEDFENYYSENPAASFAAQVWTNNAWIAAAALATGVLLGIPVVLMLLANVVNVAISGGLMAANGRLDIFFGLITPHGLLELTAVFVAAGAGLRLGWTVIDPGPYPRSQALAVAGRSAIGMAIGLAGVLFISGAIEAYVTPSGLPTWARIAIGVVAELLFLAYVWIYGRRAVRAGESGDVDESAQGSAAPVAA